MTFTSKWSLVQCMLCWDQVAVEKPPSSCVFLQGLAKWSLDGALLVQEKAGEGKHHGAGWEAWGPDTWTSRSPCWLPATDHKVGMFKYEIIFSQPFYGVHCVWDIFLLRTAPSSHPKESHDAEVFFFLLAFNINGTIAPWSKSKKIRTNISRLELLQLLELPLEDREVSSNETIPMMMMMVQPQNGGYCDNDDNGDCFF